MCAFNHWVNWSKRGGRTGLVVRASDSGSGDPGSILSRVGVLFPWARDIYSPKVLVIPRNRVLRPNMTEKLFTGTLRIKSNKQIEAKVCMEPPRAYSINLGNLLIFIIVRPGGAGAFSRDFTTKLAPQCRAFSGALEIGKLGAPLFPGPKGAVDSNDLVRYLKNDRERDRERERPSDYSKTGTVPP